jgi:hypothetical protein
LTTWLPERRRAIVDAGRPIVGVVVGARTSRGGGIGGSDEIGLVLAVEAAGEVPLVDAILVAGLRHAPIGLLDGRCGDAHVAEVAGDDIDVGLAVVAEVARAAREASVDAVRALKGRLAAARRR